MCMIGVPSGAASLHGHWTLPTSSSFANETPAKVGVVARDLVHDLARSARSASGSPCAVASSQTTSHSCLPFLGAMTGRTRLMRRSALVKVPSFSRNDVPGKNTCANLAVSFKNRSCTMHSSSAAERGLDVVGVRVGLGDVLALDEQALEGPLDGAVEHVRDAQPGLGVERAPPELLEDVTDRRRRRRGGSRRTRAGTSPCRTSPARCSGRAAG